MFGIRDGEFNPDETRADFFRTWNPLVPGIPGFVFQSGTPTFLGVRIQQTEHKDEMPIEGGNYIEAKPEVADREDDVPSRTGNLVSSSEYSFYTCGCNDVETECKKLDEVDESQGAEQSVQGHVDAYVKNSKRGVIHLVPDIGPEISMSVYANGELLQRCTTKCGRTASTCQVHIVP